MRGVEFKLNPDRPFLSRNTSPTNRGAKKTGGYAAKHLGQATEKQAQSESKRRGWGRGQRRRDMKGRQVCIQGIQKRVKEG